MRNILLLLLLIATSAQADDFDSRFADIAKNLSSETKAYLLKAQPHRLFGDAAKRCMVPQSHVAFTFRFIAEVAADGWISMIETDQDEKFSTCFKSKLLKKPISPAPGQKIIFPSNVALRFE